MPSPSATSARKFDLGESRRRRTEADHADDEAISVRELSRSFGTKVALDGLSFRVRRGMVTGFLGPNGAGKTTAIRILVGLDHASSGQALVFGAPFDRLEQPAARVGTLLDGAGFHPGRTARDHLVVLADQGGIARDRVGEVLDEVGLRDAASRRVGPFSLGMRRRLGLASALLGEPDILVLDEPSNGLDPAGTRWLRGMLRGFAERGGAVLVSSHVLADVAQTADDVVVIDQGRTITQCSVAELTKGSVVVVRTPQPERLRQALDAGVEVVSKGGDRFELTGVGQEEVGVAAASAGIVLLELTSRGNTLEDMFFTLTGGTA